ncbi:MAG: cytochrome b subunit of formate dehydrogenase [Bacillales bacterium]|jgi:formate dehydrogenase gamma subunit|nr:cytochrome b subunit of formate dehydrogenase [Bacillales bacterium]
MENNRKIIRQSLSNRIVHWGIAISTILLIVSGFGNMPMYKRYNIVKLPFGEFLGSFINMLYLHYLSAAFLCFFVFYHLFVHYFAKEFDILPRKGDVTQSFLIIKAMITKSQEPPSDKYLAEQRIAYAFIGGNVLTLVITGFIKMLKNLDSINIPNSINTIVTNIHNAATMLLILGLIGHIAAFIFKENRKMIPGMFTGKLDEDYVKHRHSIWYENLTDDEIDVSNNVTKEEKKFETSSM